MSAIKKKTLTPEEMLQEARVPEEEQPYEVPGNWVWVRLGQIAIINPPKYNPKNDEEDFLTTFIPMSSVSDVHGIIEKPEARKYYDVKKGYTSFLEDDVLFAKITPCMENGKAAIAKNLLNGFGYGSTEFHVLRVKKILNNHLLYYLVRSQYFRNQAKAVMTGAVGQQRVPKNFLNEYPFPLPPVPEQKRIVARVESLLDKINQAKELIDEARETFADRRAVILAKAFRGELTKKWREQTPNTEPAEKLLERIKEEKAKLSNGKGRKQAELPPIETPYELPEGWCWVRLGEITETSTYGSSAKTSDDVDGIPVLRMGNIQDGEIQLNDLKYLQSEHEDVKKLTLETNDLLFNRTNSYELVGKTALVRSEHNKMIYASYLIRISLYKKEFFGQYICWYINSYQGKMFLKSQITQQVGQANINAKKLLMLPVPIPPESEIKTITSLVKKQISIEKEIKALINLNNLIERLNENILSVAFRGQLGTNDPTEKSALETLKEIISERDKSEIK